MAKTSDVRACGDCGHANRLDRKFCGGCGASVVRSCGRCSFANDLSDRFCGQCAGALDADGAVAARPIGASKFKKLAPKGKAPSKAAVKSPIKPAAAVKLRPPAKRPVAPTPTPRKSRCSSPPPDSLTSKLVALNRAKVAQVDAIDLTEELQEISEDMAQDQIDALFQQ